MSLPVARPGRLNTAPALTALAASMALVLVAAFVLRIVGGMA